MAKRFGGEERVEYDFIVKRDFKVPPKQEDFTVKRTYKGYLVFFTFVADRPELVLRMHLALGTTVFEFERSLNDLYDERLLGYTDRLPWLSRYDTGANVFVVNFTPSEALPFQKCIVSLRNPSSTDITISKFEALLLKVRGG